MQKILDKKLGELRSLLTNNNVNQEQIISEMTEGERKLIENIGGLPYMQAVMNLAGVPIGTDGEDNSESELD